MVVAAVVHVLLVRTAVVADAVRADLHDPVGQPAHEPAVVRDEHQRAREVLQPLHQGLDRLQVKVVGRLVEHEHVGRADHQAAEHQPRRFPTGKRAEPLVGVVAGEEDHPHPAAREARPLPLAVVADPRLGGPPFRRPGRASRPGAGPVRSPQVVLRVLREVAGPGLVPPIHRALVRLQASHHDLEQRRLADPVGPHNGQTVPPPDPQVDVPEHLVVPERLAHPLDAHDLAPAGPPLLEVEGGIAPRTLRQLHQPLRLLLDHAHAALGLAGLRRLGAEAVHELPVVRDLALAQGDLLLAPLAFGGLGLQETRVVPRIPDHGLVVNVQNVRGHVVEEAVVVADHDHGAAESAQELLQPADRDDVEVVRGLIEEEHVGRARQDLGQQHPQPEAP